MVKLRVIKSHVSRERARKQLQLPSFALAQLQYTMKLVVALVLVMAAISMAQTFPRVCLDAPPPRCCLVFVLCTCCQLYGFIVVVHTSSSWFRLSLLRGLRTQHGFLCFSLDIGNHPSRDCPVLQYSKLQIGCLLIHVCVCTHAAASSDVRDNGGTVDWQDYWHVYRHHCSRRNR
jgi:hypothetical protein